MEAVRRPIRGRKMLIRSSALPSAVAVVAMAAGTAAFGLAHPAVAGTPRPPAGPCTNGGVCVGASGVVPGRSSDPGKAHGGGVVTAKPDPCLLDPNCASGAIKGP